MHAAPGGGPYDLRRHLMRRWGVVIININNNKLIYIYTYICRESAPIDQLPASRYEGNRQAEGYEMRAVMLMRRGRWVGAIGWRRWVYPSGSLPAPSIS